MIDNIVPCFKQSEVSLPSKLFQLFDRRKTKDEDIYWCKSAFFVFSSCYFIHISLWSRYFCSYVYTFFCIRQNPYTRIYGFFI